MMDTHAHPATERPHPLFVCLFLALLSAAVWVHRIHVDRPTGFSIVLNSDAYRYFYPTAAFLHRELRQGNLPLWNPYQFAGQPFVGLHVPGAFYPPNVVLMGLLDPPHALAALFVLHVAIAGISTWLFTTCLGLGRPAALLAAITYMLSGPMLLGIYMTPFLTAQALLPAILYALHRLLEEARPRWAVALAVTMSFAFLGGHAQGFVYEAQFAVAYGVFGLVRIAAPGTRLRVIALAALAGLLTLGFTAPQLLPALELAARGTRGLHGVPVEVAARGHATGSGILWGLLGHFETYRWSRGQGPVRWLVTLPAATIPLLACGALSRRLRGYWVFFLAMAALVALFMLGDWGPVFPLYHRLPFGNLFRNPLRIAFLYSFLAAILIGIGMQGFAERGRAMGRRAAAVTGAVVLVAALTGVEIYARTKLGYGHPILGVSIPGVPTELVDYMRSRAGLPRVFVEQTTFLPRPMLLDKAGMMHGIFVVPDYEPNTTAAYLEYFGLSGGIWHGRLNVLSPKNPRPPQAMARLLDLMSVRYYAALDPLREPTARALAAFAGSPGVAVGSVRVFERPTALPRAYTVRDTIGVPDMQAALQRVTTDDFRPRDEAVVLAGDAPLAAPEPAGTSTSTAADQAEIIRYGTEEVAIRAACGARCLLVLTDLDYPGWHAYVDGATTTIRQVNALFRGIYLDPGSHEVVFRYQPTSLRVGVAMFVAALVVAGILARADRRAGRTV
jgi:hypothetical protein